MAPHSTRSTSSRKSRRSGSRSSPSVHSTSDAPSSARRTPRASKAAKDGLSRACTTMLVVVVVVQCRERECGGRWCLRGEENAAVPLFSCVQITRRRDATKGPGISGLRRGRRQTTSVAARDTAMRADCVLDNSSDVAVEASPGGWRCDRPWLRSRSGDDTRDTQPSPALQRRCSE